MIGQTISHYKIIDKLGQGGMGVVYLAEDLKLKRKVALKFLPAHLQADGEEKNRFVHEARAASALQHHNVATIHEIGETDDGQLYICMDYYDGQTLKEKISRGPLPISEATDIACQIATGLNKAHARGIVHRDIKPANIMLVEDGVVKILDFGLAKLKGQTKLTRTGATLGTVTYMAPEQARGAEADHRADIWALGVVIYEMIAGRPPYRGDYEQAVLYSITNEIHESLTALRTGVPRGLEGLVDKCLAKDPELRYRHADELIVDLQRLKGSDQAAVSLRKPALSGPGRAGNFRVRLFSLLALVILLVLVGGYMLIPSGPAEPAGITGSDSGANAPGAITKFTQWRNSIAVLPFRDLSPAGDQEYFCDGMTDALNSRLAKNQELKVISTTSVMRFKGADRDLTRIGSELGVAHILEGTIQREGDRLRLTAQLIDAATDFHLWSETYDEQVESLFDVQDRITRAIAGALQVTLVPDKGKSDSAQRPMSVQAYEYYMKGIHYIKSRYVVTFDEADFQTGVALLRQVTQLEPLDYRPWHGLAWAYEHHYHVTDSEADALKMREVCEKALSLDPDSAPANAINGYLQYTHLNAYDRGFQHLTRAVSINPNEAEVNLLTGICLLYHGLNEQAMPFLKRGIELDPFYLWTPYKLAMCYMATGEYESASRYFEKYFKLAPVSLTFPEHYIALELHQGNLERVAEFIHTVEVTHPEYYKIPYIKALWHASQGQHEQALALSRDSKVYALMGMVEEALKRLELEIRGTSQFPYIYFFELLNHPCYQPIRDDSRFQALIAREKELYLAASRKYAIK